MLLNNEWVTEEILKYLETNENENTITVTNLWYTEKAVLRGKFVEIQAYLRKQEKSQLNNLILHLKELEKEEQIKPKVRRRKDIINQSRKKKQRLK